MRIEVANGKTLQAFVADDLPLSICRIAFDEIQISADVTGVPLAWIQAHPNGLAVHPEKGRDSVRLEGQVVTSSTWIQSGQTLTVGQTTISVTADGDIARFEFQKMPIAHSDVGPLASGSVEQMARIGRHFGEATGGPHRRLRPAAILAATVLALLAVVVIAVLAVAPVDVRFSPEADAVSIVGTFPVARFGDRYLAIPGDYVVEAKKDGYRDIQSTLQVARRMGVSREFSFEKLGGILKLRVSPPVAAVVQVDGVPKGSAPLEIEIGAGRRMIGISAERYLPIETSVDVEGRGQVQELSFELKPAWATVQISSRPAGAEIRADGVRMGTTPSVAELLQGRHTVEISLAGWKSTSRTVEVVAGVDQSVPPVELERADGTVQVATEPAGATVAVNGAFRGQTPISLPLVGDREYQIAVSKAGYEPANRSVRVEPEKSQHLTIRLEPEMGTVFVTTTPPGVRLRVNGRDTGAGSQRLQLQTLPQTIEGTLPGYETQSLSVTPQKSSARRIEISLKTVGQAQKEKFGSGMRTAGGQTLIFVQLLKSATYSIGSSRRDPLRRSNEAEYAVELTRSFLISEKEVTNQEFRKFKSQHSSGSIQGANLDGADQPVVNVSWEDAARYANWLSKSDGLEPAYVERAGKMVAATPMTHGYRLPSEAEWEFVARFDAGLRDAGQPLRFAWGDSNSVPSGSGNFAHEGSGLPFTIPGYVDSYLGTAPVGSFRPNAVKIYDLSGNAAEWCHDFYSVGSAPAQGTRRDPLGPAEGRYHVVKGSSWRSGSLSELRFAYRDYTDKPRDDLGFRVVRYVD